MSDENGKRSGVLHMTYKDAPMDFDLTEKTVGQIEQFIDGLLSRGWKPPQVARGGFGGFRPSERVKPKYDDDGNPLCPVHMKPLNEREWEGRKFWSCPAKAQGEEKANAKGWCALKFDV